MFEHEIFSDDGFDAARPENLGEKDH